MLVLLNVDLRKQSTAPVLVRTSLPALSAFMAESLQPDRPTRCVVVDSAPRNASRIQERGLGAVLSCPFVVLRSGRARGQAGGRA